jgi:hypothetical protein
VTAAPLRNECPEKPAVEMPALRRSSCILNTKYDFEKGWPGGLTNKGDRFDFG